LGIQVVVKWIIHKQTLSPALKPNQQRSLKDDPKFEALQRIGEHQKQENEP